MNGEFFTFFWDLGYMQYLSDFPQQLMDKMWPSTENLPVFIALAIGYFFGFLLYTEALRLEFKNKQPVYPIFVHCYMITIDIIGTITFWSLAATHEFYWFFVFQACALMVWVCLEAICIIRGIKSERARNMEWGKLVRGGVSEKKGWFFAAGVILVGFSVNMYLLSLIGGMSNAAIWIIYPWTSYVYAIFTWRFWDRRALETGQRSNNSLMLQFAVIGSCIVGWCPGLSLYWAVSPFFHQPWTILGGIGVTVIAVYSLYRCIKLPKYNADTLKLAPIEEYKA